MIMTITSAEDLYRVALAFEEAIAAGFMARDYAKLVWKKILSDVGLEIPSYTKLVKKTE